MNEYGVTETEMHSENGMHGNETLPTSGEEQNLPDQESSEPDHEKEETRGLRESHKAGGDNGRYHQ